MTIAVCARRTMAGAKRIVHEPMPQQPVAVEPLPDEPRGTRRERVVEQSLLWKAEQKVPAKPIRFGVAAHVHEVIERVAKVHGVGAADIIGRSRVQHVALARHEAIAAVYCECRDFNGSCLSTPRLGRLFGGRDHTTILNSLQRMRAK